MKDDYTYCKETIENIENYALAKKDNFKGWVLHHKLETHDKYGNKREEEIPHIILKSLGLYYYRPAAELVFMTNSEHSTLHNSIRKSYTWSQEQRDAQSKRLKGKTGRKWTEEEKKAQSERRKKFFQNGGQVWNKGMKSCYSEKALNNIRQGTKEWWEGRKDER